MNRPLRGGSMECRSGKLTR